LPIQFLRGATLNDKLRAQGAVGATFDPTTGRLHGLDLLHGLRDVLVARGVAIHEDSPVVRIDEGREHVVTTANGSVRAPALVIATNGYTPSLGYFRGGILPLHSHCIATEPVDLERWKSMGWGDFAAFSDDLDRIAYASLSEDGRLLFGGGGNGAYSYYFGGRTQTPTTPERQFEFVKGILARYFPEAKDLRIAHRWTGTLGVTMSRVCSMGVRGAHKNVFYALGYSGHGVVLANLAGRVLADLYSDHHEPWRDLPFYQAPVGGIPPEPFRWVGYQAFTRLTGRSPRRYEAHDKLAKR
jgi:glycine/D-amino acid oxidase-like deaminating enzyme